MAYTLNQFHKDFPDDEACLKYIFEGKFGKNPKCPKCRKEGFHRVKTRRCYACAWCGHQIFPTAGTIFHKSSTKLKDWFLAIFLAENGDHQITPQELRNYIGVSLKTARRMVEKIREDKE
ncbi:MAG: IS1595 family transposase [bacterium]|nr:IS1595 family transposase [bacterium]